jgi:hypothetical protein
MATEKPTSLTDPVLLSPRHNEPSDVSTLTFEWEPVELAQGYILQVAQDTSFEHIVLDEPVGDVTRYDASGRFPDDRSEFFWRVMSEADGELSSGEHIESFIGLSAEEAKIAPEAQNAEDSDDLGPYPSLIGAALREAKSEAMGKPDEERARLEAMGVEPEGVESAQVLGIAIAVLVAVAIISVLLVVWKGNVTESVEIAQISVSGYPELRETEIEAASQLTQYQVISDAQGIYQIPIDEAMRLMVNEAERNAGTRQTSTELPLLYR